VTTNREHIKNNFADQNSKAFFSGGKFIWKKSNAMVWNEIEKSMEEKPSSRSLSVRFISRPMSIAAGLLLLIGIGTFIRFYQVTIQTPAGEHQLAEMPDGSTINLNAESTLKYHPYWWKFNRELHFEGEAFFEVQKGGKFSVISKNGTTQVLGTSFNIFSRNDNYKVTCLTGSVQVISKTKNNALLQPNSKAEIQPDGTIEIQHNIEPFPEISWKKNIFMFTAVPAYEVFHEIERQFGVKVTTNMNSHALYTGNFSRDLDVEEILGYVCPALGLDYNRKTATEFVIVPRRE